MSRPCKQAPQGQHSRRHAYRLLDACTAEASGSEKSAALRARACSGAPPRRDALGRPVKWRTSRLALAVVSAIALTCLAQAPSAHAQRSVLRRPALHWVRGPGAESCIDPRALALAVEELVGPVLVRPSEAEHAVEGHAEVLPKGALRVRLRVLDIGGAATGERLLEHASNDCAAITPAIAFVIAMMIDPGVAAHGLPPALIALLADDLPEELLLGELRREGEGGDAPVAPQITAAPLFAEEEQSGRPNSQQRAGRRSSPRRAPARIASPEEPPVAPPASARELGVQAALLVQLGLREAEGLLWSGQERMLFELGGPLALAAHVRGGAQAGSFEFVPDRTLRIALLAAGVALCAGHTGGAFWRLNGCGGAELSGALARGDGLAVQRPSFRADVGLVLQLTARMRLYKSWGLTLLATGRLGLVPPKFLYEDRAGMRRVAYTMERLSVSFAAGPTYEF